MGMAASQARLLSLTVRMHDIELRAQNIQAQKVELATREDAAYEKYCAALDATKIQVGYTGDDYKTHYMDACYANVCGYQPDNLRQYSLINNRTGKVIVPQEVKDLYDEYGSDKYAFVMAALGYDSDSFGWEQGGPFGNYGAQSGSIIGINGDENGIFNGDFDNVLNWSATQGNGSGMPPGCGSDIYMSEVEYVVFDCFYNEDSNLRAAYDALLEASQNDEPAGIRNKLLAEFRDCLYENYGEQIIELMNLEKGNFVFGSYDSEAGYIPNGNDPLINRYDHTWGEIEGEYQYYANIWDQINSAGGCEVLDSQYMSGDEGVEWFKNAITSGLVSIYMLERQGNKGWEITTISTNVGNNYLQEVTDDDAAKKAEAEYQHELKIINRKDTKFDTELKKLETEESACQKEIESAKKIIQQNIEQNFNLFS